MTELRIALTFDAEHPDRPRCEPDVQERLLLAGDPVRPVSRAGS